MASFSDVIFSGEPKKRYQAYILHNPGQKDGEWPGPWWGRVSDVWGFGIDGFLTDSDAWKFLQESFPNEIGAVQEVVWEAYPTGWSEAKKPGERGW